MTHSHRKCSGIKGLDQNLLPWVQRGLVNPFHHGGATPFPLSLQSPSFSPLPLLFLTLCGQHLIFCKSQLKCYSP